MWDPLAPNPILQGDPEANRRAALAIANVLARPAKGVAALTGMADPSVAPWLQSSIIPEKYNHPYGTPQAEIERAQQERVGEPLLGFVGNIAKVGPKIAQALRAAEAPGIRAYHGSPHDFDRFDLSKIGTGEGAQAYGHGLYFAEKEGVARSYRDALTNTNPTVRHYLNLAQGDRDIALRNFNRDAKDGAFGSRIHPEEIEFIRRRLKEPPGRMYEVNIRAKPEEFLDWDKPLHSQPQNVRDFAETYLGKRNTLPGGRFYDLLSTKPSNRAETAASMRDAGIPGIRYLDQGSRPNPERIKRLEEEIRIFEKNAPKDRSDPWYVKTLVDYKTQLAQMRGEGQTSNYVLFRDDIIDILRKYGIPAGGIAGAGALGATAAPDQAQAAPVDPAAIARALREGK